MHMCVDVVASLGMSIGMLRWQGWQGWRGGRGKGRRQTLLFICVKLVGGHMEQA